MGKTKSPYDDDYDKAQLLSEFATAIIAVTMLWRDSPPLSEICAKERERDYLFGVLLARLRGVRPPFKEGDRVEAIDPFRVDAFHPVVGARIIKRLQYGSDGLWSLWLDGDNRPRLIQGFKSHIETTTPT